MRNRNSGLTSKRLSATFDPGFEASVCTALLVHRHQGLDVGIGHGPPVRTSRERRKNSAGALGFLGSCGRAAERRSAACSLSPRRPSVSTVRRFPRFADGYPTAFQEC